jgi:predicted HAD superfamily Cof-like phosphohydrolase
MSIERDVRDFHERFGHPAPRMPVGVSGDSLLFRIRLMREELEELERALLVGDLEGAAGEAVDLVYVVVGTAVAAGLPFDRVWEAVHRANMRKVDNPGGKPLKPDGWVPADVGAILDHYRQERLLMERL